MIDSKQATEALSEINEIARRVRQSTIYRLSSLLIIMWGVLVFAGNLSNYLSPRTAGCAWIAVSRCPAWASSRDSIRTMFAKRGRRASRYEGPSGTGGIRRRRSCAQAGLWVSIW